MLRPKLFTEPFEPTAVTAKKLAARPAPKAPVIKKNKGSAADPSKPAVLLKGGMRCELSRRSIARGGEGDIYTIENDNKYCCKIFKRPLNAEQEARLADTIEMFRRLRSARPEIPAFICPPDEIVYDRDGKPVGFIMRIADGKPLSYYTRFEINFLEGYCRDDQLFLCEQIAYIAGLFHTSDIVIGDLDESNIIVREDGGVVFVDLNGVGFSSYAAQGFHSTMMSPEHIAAGGDYEMTKADDLWALENIIFRLLLTSFEPYNYLGCKDDEEDVTEGNYFWTDERKIVSKEAAALYSSLPIRLKVYFAGCFHREGEYYDASKRPDAFTVMRMLHKCREDIRKG